MSKRNRNKESKSHASGQKQMEKAKRIQSLKTLYFNRFMIVRYAAAACFFGNIYLAVMAWPALIAWPAIALIVLALPALWQLGAMYGKRKVRFEWIRIYTTVQWLFNIVLFVSVWTVPMSQVLPFFTDTLNARLAATAMIGIGLVLLTLSVFRLQRISTNSDKTYRQIHFYEQKYNLFIDSL